MNENLDLTKILDGCPKGIKFYSTTYGIVEFIGVDHLSIYPISMKLEFGGVGCFTKNGRICSSYDGECTLFPSKDQRDWSKFKRFWDKPKVERFDPETFLPFDKVLVRDYGNHNWECALFSHIEKLKSGDRVITVGSFYYTCIPYNNETKHLIGTKSDCPDYYKWWEE